MGLKMPPEYFPKNEVKTTFKSIEIEKLKIIITDIVLRVSS